jgi:arylsulfatase A-like enzyme
MINKSLTFFLQITLLLNFIVFLSCTEKKSNVILIVVDDLGWKDLGYSGSTFYESPNIDLLSENSIRFTNAYAAAAVCSPTRAAIMTGKHPARVNITDWIPGDDPQDRKLLGPRDLSKLPLAEITLAEVLKQNGYRTFFAGKWHLGGEGYYPEDQGFEINFGGHEMGQPPGGYYAPYKNPKLIDGPAGEYLTDRLTNESIKFLKGIGDTPFFLCLPYYTVHTPIQASKKHIDKFREKLSKLEQQEIIQKIDGNGITTINQRNPDYASMVYAMDENIGRLITTLKQQGLYEQSSIIFTSDNGGLTTLSKKYISKAPTAVTPLRGGKGWLYEGGIRIPLLIKPPGFQKRNEISKVPVISHDLFPTILSLAGIEYDAGEIDGEDISKLLERNAEFPPRELFWHYPHYHSSGWTPGAAIRQGEWKLLEFYETNKVELYNLEDDISEANDLSLTYPDQRNKLLERLHTLQKEVNANEVVINPVYEANKEIKTNIK